MTKKIVLIGAGRVAFHLAQKLSTLPDYEVIQVFSRRLAIAEDLVERSTFPYEVQAINEIKQVEQEADFYIFALADSALESVWGKMPSTKGLWLHTAGSVKLEAMTKYHSNSGVLYPLQTFSKERTIDWSNLPLYLEVQQKEEKENLQSFANKLSDNLHWVDSSVRAKLHCSAVFACNFTNHLVALSEELLSEAGLDSKTLLPLLDETFAKLHELPAKEAQTGPAIRRDENTMNAHLQALSHKPSLAKLYQILSQSIQDTSLKTQ